MIDIPFSHPTAGQGILFPNKVDDNASVSGSSVSSSRESKKRGEKKIFGRNHKGERLEKEVIHKLHLIELTHVVCTY